MNPGNGCAAPDYPHVLHLFPIKPRYFCLPLLPFWDGLSAAFIHGDFFGAHACKSPNVAAVKSDRGFPPDRDDRWVGVKDSEMARRDDDADGKRSAEKEDEGCSQPSGERGERGRVGVGLGLYGRESATDR